MQTFTTEAGSGRSVTKQANPPNEKVNLALFVLLSPKI
ncbi:hypothetical protein B835_1299 [Enterococcus mundtii 3F]|nr:hypothetical protein [Enterococcus mundtii 3F]